MTDTLIRLRQVNNPEFSGFIVNILNLYLSGESIILGSTGQLINIFYPLSGNPSGYLNSGNLNSGVFVLKTETGDFLSYSDSRYITSILAISDPRYDEKYVNLTGQQTISGNKIFKDTLNINSIADMSNLKFIDMIEGEIGPDDASIDFVNFLLIDSEVNTSLDWNNRVLSGIWNASNIKISGNNVITTNQTGNFYDSSNPSGFITGLNTGNFVDRTSSQFISGAKEFRNPIQLDSHLFISGHISDTSDEINSIRLYEQTMFANETLSIDWNLRRLYDTDGNPNLNYQDKVLSGDWKLNGNEIITSDETGNLVDLGSEQTILGLKTFNTPFNATAIQDLFGDLIIDLTVGVLNDSANLQPSIKFNDDHLLFDQQGLVSLDFGGARQLITDNLIALDWNNRVLSDSGEVNSINWNTRYLQGNWSGDSFVDLFSEQTISGSKIFANGIETEEISSILTSSFLDLFNGKIGVNNNSTIDFVNLFLIDNNSQNSLDWNNRLLIDENLINSLDWDNRILSGNWTAQGFNISGNNVITANQTGIFITSGQTGLLYPRTNPSGYITSGQTGNFVNTSQTGTFTGVFYPLNSNPSNFVTSSQTGSFITTGQTGAFGNIFSGNFAVKTGNNTFSGQQTIVNSITSGIPLIVSGLSGTSVDLFQVKYGTGYNNLNSNIAASLTNSGILRIYPTGASSDTNQHIEFYYNTDVLNGGQQAAYITTKTAERFFIGDSARKPFSLNLSNVQNGIEGLTALSVAGNITLGDGFQRILAGNGAPVNFQAYYPIIMNGNRQASVNSSPFFTDANTGAGVMILTTKAANPALACYGASGQSWNIFEIKDYLFNRLAGFNQSGYLGIGIQIPSAKIHISGSTGLAGTTPLKLGTGTLVTTPEVGSFEFDGNSFYITDKNSVRGIISTGNNSLIKSSGNFNIVSNSIILVDTTTSLATGTMPNASGLVGVKYTIKDWKGNSSVNNIIITGVAGQTFDGSLSKTISTNYGTLKLISDNQNWCIV